MRDYVKGMSEILGKVLVKAGFSADERRDKLDVNS